MQTSSRTRLGTGKWLCQEQEDVNILMMAP